MRVPGFVVGVLFLTALAACSEKSSDVAEQSADVAEESPDVAVFESREYSEVEQALSSAGLKLCDTQPKDSDFSGSHSGKTYSVGVVCSEDGADDDLVVVSEYNSDEKRNAAASVPFGDKIVGYSFGKFVVSVTESSKPETLELFVRAMDSVKGAVKGYDNRN